MSYSATICFKTIKHHEIAEQIKFVRLCTTYYKEWKDKKNKSSRTNP